MILVYGGSFNPPTIAHLEIIKLLNGSLNPSKIIILPVGNKYSWKTNLLPFETRKEMLFLTFNQMDNVVISDLENKDTYEGTYQTLKSISHTYDTKDVYFIFGTDHLETLHKWINYEALLKDFNFIIIKRKNYELDLSILDNHQANYKVFSFDNEASSTKVRSNYTKYKKYITKEVYEYIKLNHLYEGDNLW